MVETSSDDILRNADGVDVAFLVVGDPLGATTHTDLLLRARTQGIPTRTIHNASILTAIGATGLQLYNFGQTVSMVFFTETWRPGSWWSRVKENSELGLHTLVLLDIKVKEVDFDEIARRGGWGKRRVIDDRYVDDEDGTTLGGYKKPRFMTVMECAGQMIEIDEERVRDGEGGDVCGKDRLAVGVGRVGTETQRIVVGTLAELAETDLGPPLHSLVVVGRRCHELERDFVREFAVNKGTFDRAWERGGYGKM